MFEEILVCTKRNSCNAVSVTVFLYKINSLTSTVCGNYMVVTAQHLKRCRFVLKMTEQLPTVGKYCPRIGSILAGVRQRVIR